MAIPEVEVEIYFDCSNFSRVVILLVLIVILYYIIDDDEHSNNKNVAVKFTSLLFHDLQHSYFSHVY